MRHRETRINKGGCTRNQSHNQSTVRENSIGGRNTCQAKPTCTEHNVKYLIYLTKSLIQHSLVPRKANHGAVTKNDMLIIYHLFFKKRLCLPHVIIQHMIVAVKDTHKNHCLPYGMMLTKIFLKLKVPLDGEESILEYTKFTPKNRTPLGIRA